MKHYRPDVVFMNLGGNDITERTDIQNLVKRADSRILSKNYIRMVLLKSSSPPSLIRHALNKKLRTKLGTDLVDVGKKIK